MSTKEFDPVRRRLLKVGVAAAGLVFLEAACGSPAGKATKLLTLTSVPATTKDPTETAVPTATTISSTATEVKPLPTSTSTPEATATSTPEAKVGYTFIPPQEIHDKIMEATKKGEFKTAVNYNMQLGGEVAEFTAGNGIRGHGIKNLPPGIPIIFVSLIGGDVYIASKGQRSNSVGIKNTDIGFVWNFPQDGQSLVKEGLSNIKPGTPIFQVTYNPDSPEQKRMESLAAKGIVVAVSILDVRNEKWVGSTIKEPFLKENGQQLIPNSVLGK